jgi:hypothetical protein
MNRLLMLERKYERLLAKFRDLTIQLRAAQQQLRDLRGN